MLHSILEIRLLCQLASNRRLLRPPEMQREWAVVADVFLLGRFFGNLGQGEVLFNQSFLHHYGDLLLNRTCDPAYHLLRIDKAISPA